MSRKRAYIQQGLLEKWETTPYTSLMYRANGKVHCAHLLVVAQRELPSELLVGGVVGGRAQRTLANNISDDLIFFKIKIFWKCFI